MKAVAKQFANYLKVPVRFALATSLYLTLTGITLFDGRGFLPRSFCPVLWRYVRTGDADYHA